MTAGSFDVMRSTRGRNSFRPRIRGSIEPAGHGSRVQGTMRLHEMVLGFLAFIFLVPGWAFMSIAGGSLLKGGPDATAFIAVGVLLLIVAVMLVVFWMESRRALRMLSELVDASRSELN
jgi:predicted Co/Zn/Cd cation transporter (cation efflux family)